MNYSRIRTEKVKCHYDSYFRSFLMVLPFLMMLSQAAAAQQVSTPTVKLPQPVEADYIARDFHFKSGESLPELRLHYTTIGKPVRDAGGRVTNAVVMLHGTGQSGSEFLAPQFSGVLFGQGQLLDATHYFIILPDDIGHGKSSKPSDGLHSHFPQYDYDDMVAAQHQLLEKALGVNHLRLVLGTSMGCMHSWVWAETYSSDMDAVMALACAPVPVAGRNWMWRKMVIDGIRTDPEWKNGDYTTQPKVATQIWADFASIVLMAPLPLQLAAPTATATDKLMSEIAAQATSTFDANDEMYALNASHGYDPSSQLEKISAPLMLLNSADDFINPPELGVADRDIKRVKRVSYVLIPASAQTRGHLTFEFPSLWQQHLGKLLEESQPK